MIISNDLRVRHRAALRSLQPFVIGRSVLVCDECARSDRSRGWRRLMRGWLTFLIGRRSD
jgi:hypothetical protein